MEKVGDVLKRLRTGYHLSQKQVAEYLGIPQQTYSNYERGAREIPIACVVNLARMYRVSTDCILGVASSKNGRYDLRAAFTRNTSLETVFLCLMELDKKKRQDFLRFLSYLKRMQNDNDSG